MATVQDLLSGKGAVVYSVNEGVNVLQATQTMNAHKIGALVVTDAQEHIVGMFTERDVLRRIVAEQRDPANTLVAVVMTTEVICCKATHTLDDARAMMRSRRVRHIPVIDDQGKAFGLVSIGDLNAHFAQNHEIEIQYMHDYIHGRV